MTFRKPSLFLLVVAVAGGAASAQTPQVSVKLLYTFQANGVPTTLVETSPGNFFGALQNPGGALFAITSAGAYKDVYTFQPQGDSIGAYGPTPALNGKAYGSALSSGGSATAVSELYSLDAAGKVTIRAYNPVTQGGPCCMVEGFDTYLYSYFGALTTPTAFARLDRDGSPTPLHTFTPDEGNPMSLLLGAGGNFLGLSSMNNGLNAGIFRLTPSGSFSWVARFPTGGGLSYLAALIQASDGNLYGTLPQGGSANAGTIYKVTPSGQFQTLYTFPQEIYGIPETLLEASDRKLYGTARGLYIGNSSIFRLDPATSQFETLVSFVGSPTASCECTMVQGSDGMIYGASLNGGIYVGGSIFVMDAGLPKPKPHVGFFAPQGGSEGQKILIWGHNLLGTTAVNFNGTPAAYEVGSAQGVWAVVPGGATTGNITITTAGGAFTTTQIFTVQ